MGKAKGGGKYIESPEKMYELFEEYVKHVKGHPVIVQDFVGKDGNEIDRKKERPLTFEGFENFLDDKGIVADLHEYHSNRKGGYEAFEKVMKRIHRVIREDQITGGMVGIYHHGITSRLNGLVDKTENKHEVTEIIVKEE